MLLFDDWLDGKLAIWLQQQTRSATADSVADAVLYATLLFGIAWLKGGFVLQQATWLGAALLSYALTTVAGLVKYGRIPSYHTRGAKASWPLMTVSVAAVF